MRKKSTGKAARRGPRSQAPGRRPAPPPQSSGALTIVGIGASAGGLEALEQFLGHVPEASGLAFVIVQHLDPTREGIMPELLQRATRMRVAQVEDCARVEPNCVYVIPPNKDLSILRGALHLLDPASPRGLRLPIDFFFRALAADQGAGSAGVILSGMGTDGTLGLTAIKEQGGVVLVQDPADARFDSMPRSAIDTRLADIIAPARELPDRLVAFLRHAPHAVPVEQLSEKQSQGSLEKIVIVLRSRSDHDFSQYKKSGLYRRIERRMGLHQIDRIENYVRYLRENPQEQDLLFNELLIGVTGFFRDPAAWEALRDKIIPALLAGRRTGGKLRAWTAGCSTGEEAYSLAMVFKEALEKAPPEARCSLQIFATDLDRSAIEKARQGLYPANIASDVSVERLRRFFVKEGGSYRVGKEIREMVILAPHDVIRDPPFTRLDLVVCRNLLIYLEQDLQRQLLPMFHYALNPGGMLFLGASETVGGLTSLFAPLDPKLRLYRRKESAARIDQAGFPPSHTARLTGIPEALVAKPVANLQTLADELILRQFGPAGALVSDKGDIFYVSGRTGKYLEPAAGKANWNVFAMAREGLRYGLVSALQKAAHQNRAATVRGLTVGANGGTQAVDVTVRPLQEPEALRGTFLVLFSDAPAASAAGGGARGGRRAGRQSRAATGLQREVKQLHDELRNTRDDMQTSQEELRSANEELQSTNEELQSTNEELTTSKEEMQSMNEELQTVNGELQAKLEELTRTSNDMKNLLDSTEIATVFLDSGLRVRRFTPQATRFLRLLPGDVGRPVTDLTSDLLYPGLADDVTEVLRTLVFSEKQVATRDGRWFTARIMPYRTLDDAIDGVVITCAEITVAKALEAELNRSHERFAVLLENLPSRISILDDRGRLVPRGSLMTRINGATPLEFSGWKLVASTEAPDREATP